MYLVTEKITAGRHKLSKLHKTNSFFLLITVPRTNINEVMTNSVSAEVNIEPNVDLGTTVNETSEVLKFYHVFHLIEIKKKEKRRSPSSKSVNQVPA